MTEAAVLVGPPASNWAAAGPGTYTLVVALPEAVTTRVGALGDCRFPAGGYGYVGSAFGGSGLGRVERHARLAAGEHGVRHWHVDSLLGTPVSGLRAVVATPEVRTECPVARRLGDGPVIGFGASDCGCRDHLAYRPTVKGLLADAIQAHDAALEGAGDWSGGNN